MRVELYDSEHMVMIPETNEEKEQMQNFKKIFSKAEESFNHRGERALKVRFDNWLTTHNVLKIYG